MSHEAKQDAPRRIYVAAKTFRLVVVLQCVVFAAALWFVAAHVSSAQPDGAAAASSPRALVLATCSGSVDETPDDSPWTIPLDRCDKAIDGMEIKTAFLQKWTICGGADSFAISLNPRSVTVTGDHVHCSTIKSEVSVTYLGVAKR
jgi:hypothetical protein